MNAFRTVEAAQVVEEDEVVVRQPPARSPPRTAAGPRSARRSGVRADQDYATGTTLTSSVTAWASRSKSAGRPGGRTRWRRDTLLLRLSFAVSRSCRAAASWSRAASRSASARAQPSRHIQMGRGPVTSGATDRFDTPTGELPDPNPVAALRVASRLRSDPTARQLRRPAPAGSPYGAVGM